MNPTDLITQELTTSEAIQYDELEAVIDRGIKTFTEVGTALLAIRDAKLYRSEHKTFDDYCKDRWGIHSSRARQLIGASKIVENIKSVTTVTPPQNESQTRPLAKLDPVDQPKAWKAATEKAETEGRTVTAKDVEEQVETINAAVKTVVGEKPKQLPIGPPCDGMQFARMAIMDLEQIKTNDTERTDALQKVKDFLRVTVSKEIEDHIRQTPKHCMELAWKAAKKSEREDFLQWVDRERSKDLPKGKHRTTVMLAAKLRRALVNADAGTISSARFCLDALVKILGMGGK